jgi:tetratricopeptide (TPR) repeat protein
VASKRSQRTSGDGDCRYLGDELRAHWDELHAGDIEPFPDERQIRKWAKRDASFAAWAEQNGDVETIALGVQDAWREFHAGEFQRAINLGSRLGPLGASAANKAAAIWVSSMAQDAERALTLLTAAADRGEQAIKVMPRSANTHYMLALVLGRYSQRVSIARALAEGLGGRVRTLLERAIELEPRHADAHIAFGLYHAEIVAKLGALAARLTYGATQSAALDHFRHAHRLAPKSPIAYLEHAHALLLLDVSGNRAEAERLYAQAAACHPRDAMERLDVARAARGLK